MVGAVSRLLALQWLTRAWLSRAVNRRLDEWVTVERMDLSKAKIAVRW